MCDTHVPRSGGDLNLDLSQETGVAGSPSSSLRQREQGLRGGGGGSGVKSRGQWRGGKDLVPSSPSGHQLSRSGTARDVTGRVLFRGGGRTPRVSGEP